MTITDSSVTTLIIPASDIAAGDILLSTLASDLRVIFADRVESAWEYDEMIYVRACGDEGDYYRYSLDDLVSVIR